MKFSIQPTDPQHCFLADGEFPVKTYFEYSQYATIIKTNLGNWYVHKLSSLVYFHSLSYKDAEVKRGAIVRRMNEINKLF